MPHKLYICIHQFGSRYVVYPATERQYLKDVAAEANDAWYYATTKSVIDFAVAGVFGVYDTFGAAEAAILSVDPGSSNIYVPPAPTNPK